MSGSSLQHCWKKNSRLFTSYFVLLGAIHKLCNMQGGGVAIALQNVTEGGGGLSEVLHNKWSNLRYVINECNGWYV